MDFLEEQSDFMNLNDDDDTYVATCHECNNQFDLHGEEDPNKCPACGIKFIKQGAE